MESLKRILIKRYAVSFALLLAATSLLIIIPIRSFFLNQERDRLESEALLLAKEYGRLFNGAQNFEENDAYLKSATEQTPLRITLILADGTVIGDSVSSSREMDNHANRFEVEGALRGEVTSIIRDSRTVERPFIYAAAPVMSGFEIIGVVRVSLSEDKIISIINEIWLIISLSFLALMLFAVAFSLNTTEMISGKLRRVSEAAARLARGDFSERVPELKIAELTELAKSFNQMTTKVATMLGEAEEEGKKLKVILGNIKTGVLVTDSTLKILIFNRAAEKIFQVGEDEAIGKRLIEIFASSELDSLLEKAATGDGVDEELELIYPRKLSLRVRATPLLNEAGSLMRLVAAIDDITGFKEINRIRTDFVANVSHELRTPVASIKAISDSLIYGEAAGDPAVSKNFLEQLDSQVSALTQLIEDLLSLSRLESKETALRIEEFDLSGLLEEALAGKRDLAKESGVELKLDESSQTGRIRADRTLIMAALLNLLDNAIKYNKTGGTVTVKAALLVDRFTVSVADTGIGIPKEDLSRIFERFYRVDPARSKERGGTGLGTSIVKHVAELHGGWVEVDSVRGQGSTFTINIPI